MHAQLLQSCLILCDPLGCSPLGSSVHRILQARILKSIAMPLLGDKSNLPSPALQVDSTNWTTREASIVSYILYILFKEIF